MRKTMGYWFMGGVMALALGACSTSRTLMSSGEVGQVWRLSSAAMVPKAEGSVRAARGSDGNTTIDVDVKQLPPASNVFDGANYYVVWLIPEGGGPAQNMGFLGVGEGEKAHLTTKTPYRNFEIIITAEADANSIQPSANHVMTGSVH